MQRFALTDHGAPSTLNFMTRNVFRAVVFLLLLARWAPTAHLHAQAAAMAPAAAQPAEIIKNAALPNLGKITPNLYRGAQPKDNGFPELKKLGIDIVVNFREDSKDEEKGRVEAQGMQYIDMPWSSFSRPESKLVAQFLQILKDHPDKKIFFHCRRGAERTGVMGAAYRMAFQKWTPEQALDEMEQFHFRGLLFHHLKSYVRSFPQQLESDPLLQPFRVP